MTPFKAFNPNPPRCLELKRRKGGRKGGREEGREEGRKGGREQGRKEGRDQGSKGGREEERKESINELVKLPKMLQISPFPEGAGGNLW